MSTALAALRSLGREPHPTVTALQLWRALEARHNLRDPVTGRFIKAGGGSAERPSLADVIRGTAAQGPKRQRGGQGMTVADAVRQAADTSNATGRPTQTPARPRRGRQVPAAVPAKLGMRIKNPDAPILKQVEEYQLKWRDGTPPGWSQADIDEHSKVLDDYMAEYGDATPARLRGTNPSAHVRRMLDDVMATSPLTEDVVVWRGLGEPHLLFGDHLDRRSMVGVEVVDPSFASTSTSRSVADEYAHGSMIVQMQVPAGTGAVHLGGDHQEVLLDRNLRWTVVADSGPGQLPRKVTVKAVRDSGGTSVTDAVRAAAPPATPKPSARRTPARLDDGRLADLAGRLEGAASRDEARTHLAGLTVPQLRQLADATGVVLGSKDTKGRALDRLVDSIVGRRLDSEAIGRMVNR